MAYKNHCAFLILCHNFLVSGTNTMRNFFCQTSSSPESAWLKIHVSCDYQKKHHIFWYCQLFQYPMTSPFTITPRKTHTNSKKTSAEVQKVETTSTLNHDKLLIFLHSTESIVTYWNSQSQIKFSSPTQLARQSNVDLWQGRFYFFLSFFV